MMEIPALRILTLSYEYPPLGGGGSHVVDGLTQELVRLGHDVDLVTMGFGSLPKWERRNGVNVYRVDTFRKKQEVRHTHEMAFHQALALPFARK